jgi:hypothetical protein
LLVGDKLAQSFHVVNAAAAPAGTELIWSGLGGTDPNWLQRGVRRHVSSTTTSSRSR